VILNRWLDGNEYAAEYKDIVASDIINSSLHDISNLNPYFLEVRDQDQ
jgi:hypothetical protein